MPFTASMAAPQADTSQDYASGDVSQDGKNNFWDFGTALLDTAGNVLQVLDKDGNAVDPNDIDEYEIDPQPAAKDYTMYYIIAAVVFFILLMIILMVARKKNA